MKLATLVSLLALSSSLTHAMSCAVPREDEGLLQSQIAFTGEVVAIADSAYTPGKFCTPKSAQNPDCGGRRATVRVTEWLRGSGAATVTVLKEDGCYCFGGHWKVGDHNLFIARKNLVPSKLEGELIAEGICGGTGALDTKRTAAVAKFKSRPIEAQVK